MFGIARGRQSGPRADAPPDPPPHGHRLRGNVCSVAWLRQPTWRHRALSRCPQGGRHRLWWLVEAPDEAAALGQLPERVSRQTEVNSVCLLPIR